MQTSARPRVSPEELERILEEIARQILDHGLDGSLAGNPWACGEVCVQICPERVAAVLDAGACRVGVFLENNQQVHG